MLRISLILILSFLASEAFTCSCIFPDSFCESNSDVGGGLRSDLILIGKGFRNSEGKISIKVHNLLSGELNTDNVKIGWTGCEIAGTPIDDEEYLFALERCGNFYCHSSCAIGFLKIEGNEVVGKIAPDVDRMKLNELGEMMCGVAFEPFSEKVEIYPNPTADIIKIKNTGDRFAFNGLQLRIFDSSGRLIHERKNTDPLLADGNWEINLEDLPRGVYIVQLYNRLQSTTKKIVKI